MNSNILRKIPSVNDILELPEINKLIEDFSRDIIVNFTRNVLDEIREKVTKNREENCPNQNSNEIDVSFPVITNLITQYVKTKFSQTFERAINATGIILHTSLGRSPISAIAIERMIEVSKGYSTLEIDKESGERSSRYKHIQSVISAITGAQDAMLVNNNAAAVLLVLDTLAKGKEVIVSRSQLVEIGGSFRIPEIMEKSGAVLVEVGTTNKTYLSDYKKAINEKTGLILIVHPSNFRIIGFTEFPDIREIAELGREYNIPTMYDIGSGALLDLKNFSAKYAAHKLPYEPTVQKSVSAGIDVTTFSTDKLLGGPQGGLITGKKEFIDLCKKNPLTRALRVDKTTLAALDATLRLYINGKKTIETIPILKMIFTSVEDIFRRANSLKQEILKATNGFYSVSIIDGTSEIGGGSLPVETIPTKLVTLFSKHIKTDELARELRLNTPSIFGRIEHDMVLLDLRTVIGDDESGEILGALKMIAELNK